MSREFCWRCRRPKEICLCPVLPPLRIATKIVLLMHPMEWRREKCTTGRITCLNLAESEIIPGLAFDKNPRYRALADDPANFPMLLYPGAGATNLSEGGFPSGLLEGRRLVVFLIDATWACARVVARESPGLMGLPRLMFTPREKSRWVIKKQPAPWCLSTLEAAHELLLALDAAGLERYEDRGRLLEAFAAMQAHQIRHAGSSPRLRYSSMKAAALPDGSPIGPGFAGRAER